LYNDKRGNVKVIAWCMKEAYIEVNWYKCNIFLNV